jgi:hypothetical protein
LYAKKTEKFLRCRRSWLEGLALSKERTPKPHVINIQYSIYRSPFSLQQHARQPNPTGMHLDNWLLITDDPHSETGIPGGFGALHRITGIPEGLISENKPKFPCK